jgi:hypothetical protein
VLANLQRKANQADKMFTQIVAEMNQALGIDSRIKYNVKEEIPSWL